jgi:hypothetical protein
MSNTVDGTSKIKNGTQGISDALTYAAGYALARDIDERGESPKGPYRGDNIPEPILVGLLLACGYEPDPAFYWDGYCRYWYDRGIAEYGK